MSIMLWVLAVLDLIGGFILGLSGNDEIMLIIGITAGVVGFAILGGFATVIKLLEEIRDNTQRGNDLELKGQELLADQQKTLKNMDNLRRIEAKAEKCEICGKNNSFMKMKIDDESGATIKKVCKDCYYKMKKTGQ